MHYMHTIKKYILYTGISLLPALLTAQGVYISSGTKVVIANAGTPNMVLNNASFINNGTFNQALSTVSFTGNDTSAAVIGGSSTTTFYNLTISRPNGNVVLKQNTGVTVNLNMNGGKLLLDATGLTLNGGTGKIIGENEQSYITSNNGGYITLSTAYKPGFRPPNAYNPGNIGIEMTLAFNPGSITIVRSHQQQTLPDGSQGIKRYFTFSLPNNANLDATLKFHYLDAELAGLNESALTMYQGSDLTSSWVLIGNDSIDNINNTVAKTGIDHLNRFTLGTQTDQPILLTPPVARQATKAGEINENISEKIQVYPVPAHDYFIVTVSNERQQQSEFLLFDELGHLLQRKKVFLISGVNNISWDISSYPAGVYYMTSNKGKANKFKIIKQ